MAAMANAQERRVIELDNGWEFSRDLKQWTEVSVPHDWAIAGPFDKKWDLQWVAIEQNGEKEKTEKSGLAARPSRSKAKTQAIILHWDSTAFQRRFMPAAQ